MFNLKSVSIVSALTIAGSLVALAPAHAGYEFGVRNTIRNSEGTGFSRSNLDISSFETTNTVTNIQSEVKSIKLEAVTDEGGFATANLKFDGSDFTGSAFASTTNIDPIVVGTFSTNAVDSTTTTSSTTEIQGTIHEGYNESYTQFDLDASSYGDW